MISTIAFAGVSAGVIIEHRHVFVAASTNLEINGRAAAAGKYTAERPPRVMFVLECIEKLPSPPLGSGTSVREASPAARSACSAARLKFWHTKSGHVEGMVITGTDGNPQSRFATNEIVELTRDHGSVPAGSQGRILGKFLRERNPTWLVSFDEAETCDDVVSTELAHVADPA